jgi:signal transduction histidine kinase
VRRLDPRLLDRLLCVAFAAMFVVDLVSAPDWRGPPWLNIALLACFIPLPLLRRSHPLVAMACWAGLAAAMATFLTNPYGLTGAFIGLFVYPYAAGAYVEGKKAWIAVPLIYGAMTAMTLANDVFIWGDIFFPGTFGAMFFVGGRAVRSRSRLTAELHEAALRADEEREAGATRAMAEERRRIAREMHDVVAHSVSMMVIQAGGARRILERDPARAEAAGALIEKTGREALREMRTLLGLLHAEDEHAEYAPQPSLRDIGALVERARVAGLPVELTVEGARRELPAGIDLAAYRVVQEALTNVVKHGGGAETDVRVRYQADAVEVTVADRGGGTITTRLDGSGHGLAGMRERVRVYGGELHAGRRRGGGFEVRALLPVQSEDEAALVAGART